MNNLLKRWKKYKDRICKLNKNIIIEYNKKYTEFCKEQEKQYDYIEKITGRRPIGFIWYFPPTIKSSCEDFLDNESSKLKVKKSL